METCMECEEVITNPLCPGCLKDAIAQWISEASPENIGAYIVFHRSIAVHMGTVQCIVCRRRMDLCAHCYCRNVLSWLERRECTEKIVSEFIDYFNFELKEERLNQSEV